MQSFLPRVSWRHVPTHTNPADCASRGLAPDLFQTHALWWSCPPWLHHPPEFWPTSCFGTLRCSSRTTLRIFSMCLARYAQLGFRVYSSWSKLLRTTAYLYHFLNRLRRSKNLQADTATLLPEEIQNAKRWLKTMQSTIFSNEIAALTHKPGTKEQPALCFLVLTWTRMDLFEFRKDSVRIPSNLSSRSDEESHRLTRAPAVSTHYPAPSSSNVACRFSINARVITSRILDMGPRHRSIRSL